MKAEAGQRRPAARPPVPFAQNALRHQPGAVAHRTVCRGSGGSVTLFAIADDEIIPEHQTPNDEVLWVLDGSIELMLEGRPRRLEKGEMCHIPPYTLHRVRGIHNGRILLAILRNPGRGRPRAVANGIPSSRRVTP